MSGHSHLSGSQRTHPRNSVPAGALVLDETIRITLLLRRKTEAPQEVTVASPLSRAEFSTRHAADLDDIEAVKAFANQNRLMVVRVRPEARTMVLEGNLGQMARLFAANVRLSAVENRIFRTREGSLQIPSMLRDRVVAVLGFDERPAATFRKAHKQSTDIPAHTPNEIAKLYDFPTSVGTGQTIALIELGDGFRQDDLTAYWKQLGVSDVHVSTISVDGSQNKPAGDPDSDDGEVVLDIEVAGAVAPGANIAVYFAPNTDAGFLDAVNTAIHDNVLKPSVISISWGAAEKEWTSQAMNAFNAAFHDAALLGITVCVASGDNGSSDGEGDKKNHVDFPASSPWVIACGGTRLATGEGKITSETVWNDGTRGGSTGGGVSSYFPTPSYQEIVKVPKPTSGNNSNGRGVPDVAGVADPETGYRVLVDGQPGVVGGTRAVASLWAALIALCNEQLSKNLGWFNPTLYGTVAQHKVLRDITEGTNGSFHASSGWDCCTGLGTPNGTALLHILQQKPK